MAGDQYHARRCHKKGVEINGNKSDSTSSVYGRECPSRHGVVSNQIGSHHIDLVVYTDPPPAAFSVTILGLSFAVCPLLESSCNV